MVLYRGPSVLDGAPIVVIATVNGANAKTGPMVQTWILRADRHPVEASKRGEDSSVCGNCPRRHALGGDCYVTLAQAPGAVYKAWLRAGGPGANWYNHHKTLQRASTQHGWRFGSYGDPAVVPVRVWSELMSVFQPRVHTGYTHQWRTLERTTQHPETDGQLIWCKRYLMASCDNATDHAIARALGWRTFTALEPTAPVPEGSIECLAERDRKPLTCETCGICNGTQGKASRASVYLREHGPRSGAKHKRSAALRVV